MMTFRFKFDTVRGRSPRRSLAMLGIMLCVCNACGGGTSHAARRPGAARALRLTWEGLPVGSSLLNTIDEVAVTQGAVAVNRPRDFHEASWMLFLTRASGGTRNLWQAQPRIEQNTEDAGVPGGMAESLKRIASWRAKPLTRLSAPQFADQASPLPDGRALLCVTNAVGPATADTSQIATFDLRSSRFTALTNDASRNHSPALAPDGRRIAFVSDRSRSEDIYVMPLKGGPAWRVVSEARHPAWASNDVLIFESIRRGYSGLYRVTLPRDRNLTRDLLPSEVRPTLLFPRAGEVAVAPDGRQLCVAASAEGARANDASNRTLRRLYMLAADGSGAQVVPGTEGARAPSFAPDGTAIIFHAPTGPAPGAAAATGSTDVLWLLPMLRVAPTAQLIRVRPLAAPLPGALQQTAGSTPAVSGEVEIIGTAFSEDIGPLDVKLEVGEGGDPAGWKPLAVQRGPVHSARLATWRVPAGAQGEWTLRLTVTDASGDHAEATFPVTLPLSASPGGVLPPPAPVTPPAMAEREPVQPDPVQLEPAQPDPPVAVLPQPPPASVVPAPPDSVPSAIPPPATTSTTYPVTSGTPIRNAVLKPPPLPVFNPKARQNNSKAGRQPRATNRSIATRSPRSGGATAPNPPAPRPAQAKSPLLASGPVPMLPLPALPPAPAPAPSPQLPAVAPPVSAPVAPPPQPVPSGGPLPPVIAPPPGGRELPGVARSPAQKRPAEASSPSGTAPETDVASYSAASGADSAAISVQGTPAVMRPGEVVPVTAMLRNTGARAWASGSQPVRLLVRWFDAASGSRTRWEVKWLAATVPPGGAGRLTFDITAPPRAGRYRLSYAMVRLYSGRYEPPAVGMRQDGSGMRATSGANSSVEFGEIAYRVEVQ